MGSDKGNTPLVTITDVINKKGEQGLVVFSLQTLPLLTQFIFRNDKVRRNLSLPTNSRY